MASLSRRTQRSCAEQKLGSVSVRVIDKICASWVLIVRRTLAMQQSRDTFLTPDPVRCRP